MMSDALNIRGNKFLYLTLIVVLFLTVLTAVRNENEDQQSSELANENNAITKRNRTPNQLDTYQDESDMLLQQNESKVSTLSLRQFKTTKIKDIFKVHNWYVAPPITKLAKKPELPTVPPVPFTYNGKFEDPSQGTVVFLVANSKVYTTKVGENVNAQWRLDADTENTLNFTYIPLNLPKALAKSATSNFQEPYFDAPEEL
jgi:hypothetical protein